MSRRTPPNAGVSRDRLPYLHSAPRIPFCSDARRWSVERPSLGHTGRVDLDAARALWEPDPGWLNTASYGLPPAPAWDELQAALTTWRHGRGSWEPWDASVGRAREAFARIVGADAHDVAIAATAAELVGLVAASLPAGSRVLVPDIEFTSNLFPWAAQQDRGIEVVTVPPHRMLEAIDDRVTVVAYSAVQSATGEVADVPAIAAAARAHGALVVVDATQALGWLALDAADADVLVCAAYKWLMCPRGTAFGVFAPHVREWVRPNNANWYAGADVHDSYYGPPLRLAAGARRYDLSPAWFSWVGAAPALELVERIGVSRIGAYDLALAGRFRAGLGLAPSHSPIVSARIDGAAERLARAGIRAATRAGGLRASFHLYNTEADVDAALEALA